MLQAAASGPLRVHPANPRYFADVDGEPVYLTGSHSWPNLIDRGLSDPPPAFDFDGYLRFLEKHNHNFIRLWARHVTWYHDYGKAELHAAPLAWPRTGPGAALDGKPRFDLTQWNEAYFARLRSRVKAAGDRGIYVSVMLFGGSYECRGGWKGNPFHLRNNINGINGDPDGNGDGLETQMLRDPSITRLQEAYVRKVVDTVNGLDNILYEISNESQDSSREWQYHLIRLIHDHEAEKGKKHPVGMTALWTDKSSAEALENSPAEWISPLTDATRVRKIAAADGKKVSIVDSDHWFVKELRNDPVFGTEWVWKSFCRGHNPILMEHLPPLSAVLEDLPFAPEDPGYAASRKAMGHTRSFAQRMNLARATPSDTLASTRYCLADPGSEYLVYQCASGEAFTVNLESGKYRYEWFNVAEGIATGSGDVDVKGPKEFKANFSGDAVLYLKKVF